MVLKGYPLFQHSCMTIGGVPSSDKRPLSMFGDKRLTIDVPVFWAGKLFGSLNRGV